MSTSMKLLIKKYAPSLSYGHHFPFSLELQLLFSLIVCQEGREDVLYLLQRILERGPFINKN